MKLLFQKTPAAGTDMALEQLSYDFQTDYNCVNAVYLPTTTFTSPDTASAGFLYSDSPYPVQGSQDFFCPMQINCGSVTSYPNVVTNHHVSVSSHSENQYLSNMTNSSQFSLLPPWNSVAENRTSVEKNDRRMLRSNFLHASEKKLLIAKMPKKTWFLTTSVHLIGYSY